MSKKIKQIVLKGEVYDVDSDSNIEVDNALSTTSENPVQNKVVTNALNGKPNVVELTQSQYNALTTKASNTLYLIQE